jgi:16S rRNA (guanine966-N2)-methyltransferase
MAKSKPTIRIISGTHRSRRLPVLDIEGLRPTGDRVREVLFNWLQYHIAGKNVLDLFAGTGALGFEAASRGANSVKMLDISKEVTDQLRSLSNEFKFENIKICQQSALDFIKMSAEKYDLVFLDPPFSGNLLDSMNDKLDNIVNQGGFVYQECGRDQELKKMSDNWELYRQKIMGQVKIELWLKIK